MRALAERTRAEATPPPLTESVAGAPRIDRRTVLRGLGLGGATILVAGTGVLSYRVYDNGILRAGAGAPYEAWESWRDDPSPLGAVAAATLAANPHNTQPWVFRATATTVDLYADEGRRMPAADPFDREQQIGIGCALENLHLALLARGYRPVVTLAPDGHDRRHLARVSLQSAAPRTSELYAAIGRRHTDQGPYEARSVARELLDRVAQHDDLGAVRVSWIDDPTTKDAMGALLVAATEAIIADREQSEEAFGWFRSSRDEIDVHRDGLTLDGQGFGGVQLTVAKLLPASSRIEGDAFWLEQTRTVHTATAAAYGVLTVTDPDDVATRLAGGRLLQRIHLAATAVGLALQPMNQLTERIDRDRSLGRSPEFGAPFERLLASPGAHPLVAFRIGYPKRPARPSPRRPLQAVLS